MVRGLVGAGRVNQVLPSNRLLSKKCRSAHPGNGNAPKTGLGRMPAEESAFSAVAAGVRSGATPAHMHGPRP